LPETVKLPHPEEPVDYSKTIENTSLDDAITLWLVSYNVPNENWGYCGSMVEIQVYDVYPDSIMLMQGMSQDIPSVSWELDNKRYMAIKPHWLNSGVIAHEECHPIWDLLEEECKLDFAHTFEELFTTDKMLQLLIKEKPYAKINRDAGNYTEVHAEVYRYLTPGFPKELHKFYPYLIGSG